jgi:hypothetical protein
MQRLWNFLGRDEAPWRLRIAGAVCRGFVRNPRKALKLVRKINIEMESIFCFKLHIHGLDFMRDFMEVATKLDLKPFILWGTLLGMIRENGFIKNDYDLDMGIFGQDYDKKDDLINGMLERGYLLRQDVPYSVSFQTPDRLLFLDVDLI